MSEKLTTVDFGASNAFGSHLFQVEIPAATHVIGSAHGATICMMRNLEIERLGLAAMGLGIARRCLNEMKSYALQRRAFGTDLYKFGQVQRLIAESYAHYVAGRSYVYGVARNLDLNRPGNGLDADGTKLFCAKMAKDVAAYIAWASDPRQVQRKQSGLGVLIFLFIFAGITYLSYRRIWKGVAH